MKISCEKKDCSGGCPEAVALAASEVLEQGKLIVYPTETLYGLGGNALDEDVVQNVRDVKGSPPDKKISTAYLSMEMASRFLDIPDTAWELADSFLPGPLTIVIETDNGTEGIRIPDHPLALSIIERFGPITSTSANLHDMEPPYDVEGAEYQLGDDVALYIDCGECEYRVGTTVVKIDGEIEILREGVVTKEEIGDVIGI